MARRAGPTQRGWVQFDVDLQDNVPGLIARIKGAQPLILDVASETLINDIKRSVDSRTGRLRESIEELGRQEDTVWVGTRLYYAVWVERGTAEHVIQPKRRRRAAAAAAGKRVAIVWPGAAHPVAQSLHPGAHSHPFMLLGKERAKRPIQQRVGDIIRRELGIGAGSFG